MNSRKRSGSAVVFAIMVALIAPGYLPAQSPVWQVDGSFAPVLEGPVPVAVPDAIVRQPDGKIVIAGRFDRINGVVVPNGYALARLLPSGATDISFSAQLSAGQTITQLRLQPDGSIVANGGPFPGALARFTAEGARKSFAFGEATIAQMEVGSSGEVSVQPVGSRFGGDVLRRYTPDGNLDPTFQNYIQPSGGRIAPLPDGSVITTQTGYTMYSQSVPGQLLRLNHNGTNDLNFVFDRSLLPGALLGLLSLPDNRALAIETIHTDFGETFDFLRVGMDGKPDFSYRAQVGLPLNPSSMAVLAGAIFDRLRDANAAATTFLQLDLGTFVNNAFVSNSVSVGADGISYVVTPAGFYRWLRVAGSGPSVEPDPTILSLPSETTVNRNLGESFSLSAIAGGVAPLSYHWLKNGVNVVGATSSTFSLSAVTSADAGVYSLTVSNAYGTTTKQSVTLAVNTVTAAPALTLQPFNQTIDLGSGANLNVWATGNPVPAIDWFFNGTPQAFTGTRTSSGGTTFSTFFVLNANDPASMGIYHAIASNSVGSVMSTPAIVGRVIPGIDKIVGSGAEVGPNIVHPNGNIYDQMLPQGPATTIRADQGQVARLSFVDLDDDIVMVEFSGAGALSLVFDSGSVSGPAAPVNYNQPGVSYIKGHAGIVIAGANETTNVSVFSVGRATAFDPTGAYNILLQPGATNVPANNGSPLFAGHGATTYDGVADIAFIAIISANQKFGGVRTANASYYATRGLTGLYAPNVQFTGPVYIGDIDAFDAAFPVLMVGSAATTQINGGDLLQANGRAVKVSGITDLRFVAGLTSEGVNLPARTNQATLDPSGFH